MTTRDREAARRCCPDAEWWHEYKHQKCETCDAITAALATARREERERLRPAIETLIEADDLYYRNEHGSVLCRECDECAPDDLWAIEHDAGCHVAAAIRALEEE